MHDLFILTKGLVLISLVWVLDTMMIELVSLSFISIPVKEFFIETKDVINWVVSLTVLYATIIKIKNENKKDKK